MEINKKQNLIIWIAITLFALTNIVVGIVDGGIIRVLAPFLSIGTLSIVAIIHGTNRYNVKTLIIMFLLTCTISWSYESLSILTGFPFGNYFYSDILGPKIGLVPILIMPAYFAVGYMSWVIAHFMLDKFDVGIKKKELVVLPVIASFIMVMWDVTIDPVRATLQQSWIWEDGGAYFGVPFVNYIGWFICVFTIFMSFSLYLYYKKDTNKVISEKSHWLQPTLMYGAIVLEFIPLAILNQTQKITSLDGHVWWSNDIYQSALLVGIMTMGFITVFNCIKILRKE
jgi:putative membrane protein